MGFDYLQLEVYIFYVLQCDFGECQWWKLSVSNKWGVAYVHFYIQLGQRETLCRQSKCNKKKMCPNVSIVIRFNAFPTCALCAPSSDLLSSRSFFVDSMESSHAYQLTVRLAECIWHKLHSIDAEEFYRKLTHTQIELVQPHNSYAIIRYNWMRSALNFALFLYMS